MYKYCTTEESVRRQLDLEQCLMGLMLTENYSQITISQICDRAGISRKSFYRYFSSKEGCLCALLDHAIFDGAARYLPGHGDPNPPGILYEQFFRYWKEKAPLLDALARNGLSTRLVERMALYVMQEERDFSFLLIGTDNDAHERSLYYTGGIMTLVLDWHKTGYAKSVTKMALILSKLI